jgi:hypothetical protein
MLNCHEGYCVNCAVAAYSADTGARVGKKVYLSVPFVQKDVAKGMGAKWNPAKNVGTARPILSCLNTYL